jgi:hypothetical protein
MRCGHTSQKGTLQKFKKSRFVQVEKNSKKEIKVQKNSKKLFKDRFDVFIFEY